MQATRSAIFKAFNSAIPLSNNGTLDRPRLNRALGVAQMKEPRPYATTERDCTCADRVYRGRATGTPCKHMISAAILTVAKGL